MELLDFILHVDDHLLEFITNYGVWIYAILFLIIFVETGLVVMPFLPGDSLLFAAGALAASTGAMDPWVLIPLLFVAAVLGDTLNYHIGKFIGPRVFEVESRFINKKHLLATQQFFARHGGKTIIFVINKIKELSKRSDIDCRHSLIDRDTPLQLPLLVVDQDLLVACQNKGIIPIQ